MVDSTFIEDTEYFISLFTFRFVYKVVLIVKRIKKVKKWSQIKVVLGIYTCVQSVFMNETAPPKRK